MKLIILLLIVLALGIVLPPAFSRCETEAATSSDITVNRVPCYPQKVIQLDEATPLSSIDCDAYYTAYMDGFWEEMTKDVIFLDGNATADVYNIGIYWRVDTIVCERVREQSSAGFYVGAGMEPWIMR